MSSIYEFLANCPQVDAERRYWFIRTDGGRLYDAFQTFSVVGIGYEKISRGDLNLENSSAESSRRALSEKVKVSYPDHERPGLVVSQLFRFTHEVRKDDIVIIPSYSSDKISIGQIVDDVLYHQDLAVFRGGETYIDREFKKFRKVKWFKEVHKRDFNPHLFQLMNSHQTIFSANDYARWIDPLLFDFFKKGDQYHLVLKVSSQNKINAQSLFRTCIDLLDFSENAVSANVEEDAAEIETKVNLNSPGDIELISQWPYILGVISLVILFVNGGKIHLKLEKLGLDFTIGTDGLITKIKEFLNSSKDRKMKQTIADKIRALEVADSKDICAMIEAVNEKNQIENK